MWRWLWRWAPQTPTRNTHFQDFLTTMHACLKFSQSSRLKLADAEHNSPITLLPTIKITACMCSTSNSGLHSFSGTSSSSPAASTRCSITVCATLRAHGGDASTRDNPEESFCTIATCSAHVSLEANSQFLKQVFQLSESSRIAVCRKLEILLFFFFNKQCNCNK